MRISFDIPRIPAGALSNLVGLAGLLAIAVAAGALLGSWWWSALIGGGFAVALAALTQAQDAAVQRAARPTTLKPVVKAAAKEPAA